MISFSLERNDSNKRLAHKIKTLFVEWCKSSSSHGIPNIASSDNYLIKFMWVICFSVSCGFCGILLVQTIIDFISNPVYVTNEIIEEMPSLFPTISICNMNPFKTSDLQIRNELENIIKDVNFKLEQIPISTYVGSGSRILRSFMSQLSDDKKKSYGNQLHEMLIGCKFNTLICKLNDFEWFYDLEYGNCYKFNPNATKFIGKSGSKSGLF